MHKTKDFAILSNGFIGSTNISCQAIALLADVMGLPKNWNFKVKGLTIICNVGETAVRNMLKELETWGYLMRTKLMPSKENGGRVKYIYEFFKTALSKEDAVKKSEKTRKNAKKAVKDLPEKKPKKSTSKKIQKQDSGFRSAEKPLVLNDYSAKILMKNQKMKDRWKDISEKAKFILTP